MTTRIALLTLSLLIVVGAIGNGRYLYAKAYYAVFVPQTYYVRPAGGTSVQCTGKTDVDYDGSGTGEACAYAALSTAVSAMTFGDITKMQKGVTHQGTVGHFGELSLSDKGTPPTGTDADYMTITTNDESGTPAALSTYPAARTRITTAMAADMPKVICNGSTPLFRVANGSEYWKVERLNITNDAANGWQTIVFVNNDDPGPATLAAVPDHIIFQYNWIHPAEETGTDLDISNDDRSAENALYLIAEDLTIQYNAIQGFVGKVRYGGDAGTRMTSAGLLITAYAANVLMQYNLVEAWTYAFFAGGSSMPSWAVTESSTISSCASQTVCTFNSVTGLNVGDPVAVRVNSVSTWGAAYVKTIVGNIVTFEGDGLCHSYDGNNTCVQITTNPIPASGDLIWWNGTQPHDILVRRNVFAHYPSWTTIMTDCGGKGYMEVKACVDCVFDGNIFTGCTGPTVTVRNQGGDFVWASLDGLTFSNNIWEDTNRVFTTFLRDTSPTPKSQDVTFTNNLYLGVVGNTDFFPGGELSGNTGGGINTIFTHNTVAWNKDHQPGMGLSAWHDYINFKQGTVNGYVYSNTMDGLIIRDNIIPIGQNSCFIDGGGIGTTITQCWPDATVTNNVFLNVDGWSTENVNSFWATFYPSNTYITSYSTVSFINPSSTLDSTGNYKLSNSSPYKNAASDGTDIGVNCGPLASALGFTPTQCTGTDSRTAIVSGKVTVGGKVILH